MTAQAEVVTARLSRRQAVPLAIGSVAGSGILFLPSAVYAEAGRNSLLVWLLATVVCLPMLLMFEDMVRANPNGDGIEAFIRSGLGRVFGRCVPLMFVALVIVGLPAGSMVAGRYVAQAVGAGEPVAVLSAAGVLLAAVAANLAGVRTSSRVQHAGTWALVLMAVVLIVAAAPGVSTGLSTVAPDGTGLGVLLPGVVLAFWAFAGFENLTFLSREFRDPRRDFLPVSATALGVYGVLTILLTVAIAVRIPHGAVDEVTGLLQLAGTVEPRQVVVTAVTTIALGAMVLNAVAWVWGVSRLVVGAAGSGVLPRGLGRSNARGVPWRAVLFLAVLFTGVTAALAGRPGMIVDAVAMASAIFIVLYLLSIVSYVRVRGLTLRSALNLVLLVVLGVSLAQSGWRSLYAVAVLAVALAVQVVQHVRSRSRQPQEEETATAGVVGAQPVAEPATQPAEPVGEAPPAAEEDGQEPPAAAGPAGPAGDTGAATLAAATDTPPGQAGPERSPAGDGQARPGPAKAQPRRKQQRKTRPDRTRR
ncbi:MAG TPA: APC family permease [Micromonosporaceae bacterium]|nr:APC family permease [Micromonosporaceae bacterium]